MTIEDDIAFFERVPTLGLLGRQALRILAIGAESRYVHGGEVLFNAGDEADGAFVIQEGSLRPVVEAFEDGRGVTVGPYTLLGEVALLTETSASGHRDRARALDRAAHPAQRCSSRCWTGFPDAARKLREHSGARASISRRARSTTCARRCSTRSDARIDVNLQRRRHRHVVGGPRPAARMLAHPQAGDAVGERGRDPDVVEAAALVGGLPVGRAVAPPRVELGRLRHQHAHGVDPAAGRSARRRASRIRSACARPPAASACGSRRRARAARR